MTTATLQPQFLNELDLLIIMIIKQHPKQSRSAKIAGK